MSDNWDNLSPPPWGNMPSQPAQKPASDVTAGSKGKIIRPDNVVTRKASPTNPMFQAER